ncbi:MAG: HNH endonuclease [Bacteroidetes bacterium]|nr:HNH endonuclease [Bacteroidota bacterium]
MWRLLGRQPTSTDIRNGYSKYSLNTFARRFGGWRNALKEFIIFIEAGDDNSQVHHGNKNSSSTDPAEQKHSENLIKKKVRKKHRTNRDVNYKLRFKILKRDNFKCTSCGASPAIDQNVTLHIDHKIPWAKGGETVVENLQTLCLKCNLGKSDTID